MTPQTQLPTKPPKPAPAERSWSKEELAQLAGEYHQEDPYSKFIERAAEENNVDPDLIRRLKGTESANNLTAVSNKGAFGLMQLMPGTAKTMAQELKIDPSKMNDPENNIRGGVRYLRQMLDRYNGDVTLAVGAYNAGPGNIDKHIAKTKRRELPSIAETQAHSKQILQEYKGRAAYTGKGYRKPKDQEPEKEKLYSREELQQIAQELRDSQPETKSDNPIIYPRGKATSDSWRTRARQESLRTGKAAKVELDSSGNVQVAGQEPPVAPIAQPSIEQPPIEQPEFEFTQPDLVPRFTPPTPMEGDPNDPANTAEMAERIKTGVAEFNSRPNYEGMVDATLRQEAAAQAQRRARIKARRIARAQQTPQPQQASGPGWLGAVRQKVPVSPVPVNPRQAEAERIRQMGQDPGTTLSGTTRPDGILDPLLEPLRSNIGPAVGRGVQAGQAQGANVRQRVPASPAQQAEVESVRYKGKQVHSLLPSRVSGGEQAADAPDMFERLRWNTEPAVRRGVEQGLTTAADQAWAREKERTGVTDTRTTPMPNLLPPNYRKPLPPQIDYKGRDAQKEAQAIAEAQRESARVRYEEDKRLGGDNIQSIAQRVAERRDDLERRLRDAGLDPALIPKKELGTPELEALAAKHGLEGVAEGRKQIGRVSRQYNFALESAKRDIPALSKKRMEMQTLFGPSVTDEQAADAIARDKMGQGKIPTDTATEITNGVDRLLNQVAPFRMKSITEVEPAELTRKREFATSGLQSGVAGFNNSLANALSGFGLIERFLPDSDNAKVNKWLRGLAEDGHRMAQERTAKYGAPTLADELAGSVGGAVPTLITFALLHRTIGATFGMAQATPQRVMMAMSIIDNADKPVKDQIIGALMARAGGEVFGLANKSGIGKLGSMASQGLWGANEGVIRSVLDDAMNGRQPDWEKAKRQAAVNAVSQAAFGVLDGNKRDLPTTRDGGPPRTFEPIDRATSVVAGDIVRDARTGQEYKVAKTTNGSFLNVEAEDGSPVRLPRKNAERLVKPVQPEVTSEATPAVASDWASEPLREAIENGTVPANQNPYRGWTDEQIYRRIDAIESGTMDEARTSERTRLLAEQQRRTDEVKPVEPNPVPMKGEVPLPEGQVPRRTFDRRNPFIDTPVENDRRVGERRGRSTAEQVEVKNEKVTIPAEGDTTAEPSVSKGPASGSRTGLRGGRGKAVEPQASADTGRTASQAEVGKADAPAAEPVEKTTKGRQRLKSVDPEVEAPVAPEVKAEAKPARAKVGAKKAAAKEAAQPKVAETQKPLGEQTPDERRAALDDAMLERMDQPKVGPAKRGRPTKAEAAAKAAKKQAEADQVVGDMKAQGTVKPTRPKLGAKRKTPAQAEAARRASIKADAAKDEARLAKPAEPSVQHTTYVAGPRTYIEIPRTADTRRGYRRVVDDKGSVFEAPKSEFEEASKAARKLHDDFNVGKATQAELDAAGVKPTGPKAKVVKKSFLERNLSAEDAANLEALKAKAKQNPAKRGTQGMGLGQLGEIFSPDEVAYYKAVAHAYVKAGIKTAKEFVKHYTEEFPELADHAKDIWKEVRPKLGKKEAQTETKKGSALPPETSAEKAARDRHGVTQASIQEARIQRGLDAALEKEGFGTLEELRARAVGMLTQNSKAGDDLFKSLNKKMRPLTADEQAVGLMEIINRRRDLTNAMDAMEKAKTPEEKVEAKVLYEVAEGRVSEAEGLMYQVRSEAGNALGFAARFMLDNDFSLDSMLAERRAARRSRGEEMTTEDVQEVKDHNKKLEEALKETEAKKEELEMDALSSMLNDQLRITSTQIRRAAAASRRAGSPVRGFFEDQYKKGQAELKALLKEVTKPEQMNLPLANVLDPRLFRAVSRILVGKLGMGTVDFADWAKETTATLGDKITTPMLKKIWKQGERDYKESIRQHQIEELGTPAEIVDRFRERQEKKKLSEVDLGLSQKFLAELVESHMIDIVGEGKWRRGEDRTAEALRRTLASVHEVMPDATEKEVKRLLVDYGKVKNPRPGEVPESVRELRRLTQLHEQERDITAGKVPEGSGSRRDKPTRAVRALQRKVNNMLRDLGIQESKEDQIVSVNSRRINTLTHQLADLEDQIGGFKEARAAGKVSEFIAQQLALKNKKAVEWNEYAKLVKEQRDLLRKERDALLPELGNKGKQPLTEEQKQRNKLNTLTKKRDRLQESLDKGEAVPPKPVKGSVADNADIIAMRTEVEALLKQTEGARRTAIRDNMVQRALAKLEERIAKGDFVSHPKATPVELSPEGLKAQGQLDLAKRLWKKTNLKIRQQNRSVEEKAVDFGIWARRAGVLTALRVIAKLINAATQTLMRSPSKEIYGHALSKLTPRLAKQAPVEGTAGLSLKQVLGTEAYAIRAALASWPHDFMTKLTTGRLDFEETYGPVKMDEELIDWGGRLHGSLKTLPMRQAFTRQVERNSQRMANRGQEIDPITRHKIGVRGFERAQESIFLNDNSVQKTLQMAKMGTRIPDKATGRPTGGQLLQRFALGFFFPVARVPTNIPSRAMRSMIGSLTGTFGTVTKPGLVGAYLRDTIARVYEHRDAKNFLDRRLKAWGRAMEDIPEEHVDLIYRRLKDGNPIAAALTFGFAMGLGKGAISIAGLTVNAPGYHTEDDREKKVKSDAPEGGARISYKGHPIVTIDSWALHLPEDMAVMWGATYAKAAQREIDSLPQAERKEFIHQVEAQAQATWTATWALIEETPYIGPMKTVGDLGSQHTRDRFIAEIIGSVIPAALTDIASLTDVDSGGILQNLKSGGKKNVIPRKEDGIVDGLKKRLPGLRSRLPEKNVEERLADREKAGDTVEVDRLRKVARKQELEEIDKKAAEDPSVSKEVLLAKLQDKETKRGTASVPSWAEFTVPPKLKVSTEPTAVDKVKRSDIQEAVVRFKELPSNLPAAQREEAELAIMKKIRAQLTNEEDGEGETLTDEDIAALASAGFKNEGVSITIQRIVAARKRRLEAEAANPVIKTRRVNEERKRLGQLGITRP